MVSAQEDKQIQMGGINVRRKAKQLPVFVYGTLLEGMGNWTHYLKGKTTKVVSGELTGFDMYAVASFPGIVQTDFADNKVYGELMYIKPRMFNETISLVDMLEGYVKENKRNSMYLRKKVVVKTECGELVEAWVYVWNRPIHDPIRQFKVDNGSWLDWLQNRN